MIDIGELRALYNVERPLYQDLATRVQTTLREETRRQEVICSIHARAKEIDSFLKKALRKGHSYDRITDKAGVRVVVTYMDALAAVDTIIRNRFEVTKFEDKRIGLKYNELGYLGLHYEVRLLPASAGTSGEQLVGKLCEIQLHTQAQSLWATVSHELLYKTLEDLPDETQRDIYHLVSLVEIFDQQIARARDVLLNHPEYQEANVFAQLEKRFYRYTTRPLNIDRALSFQVIGALKELYTEDQVEHFGALLDDFLGLHGTKVAEIFEDYRDDTREGLLFLFQPESLLIFERLENDQYHLQNAWSAALPLSLLSPLSSAWGKPISNDADA